MPNIEIKSEIELFPLQKTFEKANIEKEFETEIKRKVSIIRSKSIK